MKHIIIPIGKFIAAIFLTIIVTIWILPSPLLYVIWHFKKLPTDFFNFTFTAYGDFPTFSPFYKETNYNVDEKCYFKSIYHYIWDI